MIKFVGTVVGASKRPMVTIFPGSGMVKVLTGDFGWEKSIHGANLAKVILTEYLGDAAEATRLHTRFLWRTIRTWPADKGWVLTGEQIEAVLKDIRGAEGDIAKVRSAIANQPPPVVSEAGPDLSPIEQKG